MNSLKIPASLVACAICLLIFALPAQAYVDPNAAGLISQILTPLLVAVAASLTFLRRRVWAALSGVAQRFRRRSNA
jgi:hypothetical protein